MIKRILASGRARADRGVVYWYYTARPRAVNPIAYARLVAEMQARRRILADRELAALIEHLQKETGSTGCSYIDYLSLYLTIQRLRPSWILECGPGVSSGVMALALERIGSGRLIGMEDHPLYFDRIQAAFPDRLRAHAEFHLSPVVERTFGRVRGRVYADRPSRPYDFVFVDGPDQRSALDGKKLFNADLVEIALAGRPVRALIDQRIATVRAIRRLLPEAQVRYSVIKQMTDVRIG